MRRGCAQTGTGGCLVALAPAFVCTECNDTLVLRPSAEVCQHMLCMLQGGWENLARATLTWDFAVHRYSPIKYVPKVTAPVLFIAATNDTLCAFESVQKAVQIAPNAQLMARDCTHFELYRNHFEGVIHDQVNFFRQHLGLGPLPMAAAPAEESDAVSS